MSEKIIHTVDYGDAAIMVRFAGPLDGAMNRRVASFTSRLDAAAIEGVIEVVPADASVLVHYDPLALIAAGELSGISPLEQLRHRIEQLAADDLPLPMSASRTFEIPLCYGGEFGPDLEECARLLGMSKREIVALHCGAEYTVGMIGFLPGFPYLSGLPERLALPRLETPRPRVPAGSVAIGGTRTGIYPMAAPGGWRIIGRCSAVLFDAAMNPPALLAPGDRVLFRPVPPEELGMIETRKWQ